MKKVFIFVLICMIVFLSFYYIFSKKGNNKISNQEKRIDDILEKYLNYEAEAVATIKSNKTENIYTIKQEVKGDYSKIEIDEPKKIIIEKSKDELKITNCLLDVEKVYQNPIELLNNYLFLNVFTKDFAENESQIEEDENEIIIKIKMTNNTNTYVRYKELRIDKKTKEPKELIIKDNAKEVRASIVYTNVKI